MEKIKNILLNLIFAFRLLKEYDELFVVLKIVHSIISAINSIYSILLLKIILDSLSLSNFQQACFNCGVAFCISFVLDYFEMYLRECVIEIKKISVEGYVNSWIYNHVKEIKLIYYDSSKYYDEIYFNLSQGATNLLLTIDDFVLLLQNLISLIGIGYIIVNCDFKIIVIILFFVSINTLFNFYNKR